MAWQTAKTAKLFKPVAKIRMKGKMILFLVLEFCLKNIIYDIITSIYREQEGKKERKKRRKKRNFRNLTNPVDTDSLSLEFTYRIFNQIILTPPRSISTKQ